MTKTARIATLETTVRGHGERLRRLELRAIGTTLRKSILAEVEIPQSNKGRFKSLLALHIGYTTGDPRHPLSPHSKRLLEKHLRSVWMSPSRGTVDLLESMPWTPPTDYTELLFALSLMIKVETVVIQYGNKEAHPVPPFPTWIEALDELKTICASEPNIDLFFAMFENVVRLRGFPDI
jgi:hypothetical protein